MDESFSDSEEYDLQLYSIRWWIAVLIAIESIVLRIIKNSFGIVNDVYVRYFNVSHLAVDWFTLIQIPGQILSSAFLAPTIFNQVIGFRRLTIIMAACLTFSCFCLIAAYVYRPLYPFIYIGQFVVGCNVIVMDVVAAGFAIKWFPENQVGFALSIKSISGNVGSLLAYLIPSNLLISPPHNSTLLGTHNSTLKPGNTASCNWFRVNQVRLIAFASILVVLTLIILLFFVLFSRDRPPKPPTIAQASVRPRKRLNKSRFVDILLNYKEFFQECKRILQNKLFLQIAILFSFTQGSNFIQKLFMGEILRKVFVFLGHADEANVKSGHVLVLFEVGCIAGSVVTGKVVDHFKNYHTQIVVDLLLCFLTILAILIGYHFHVVAVIYIANTLFGFFISFLVTPIFEIVYQHLYPTDTGFLTLLLRIECSVGIILIGQVCRLLLDLFNGTVVLTYLSSCLFVALLISLFLKPTYARLNVEFEKTKSRKFDEKTPLIHEKI